MSNRKAYGFSLFSGSFGHGAKREGLSLARAKRLASLAQASAGYGWSATIYNTETLNNEFYRVFGAKRWVVA